MNWIAYSGDTRVSFVVCPRKWRNDPRVLEQLCRVLWVPSVRLVPYWGRITETAYRVIRPGVGGYLPPLKWAFRFVTHRGVVEGVKYHWMFGIRGHAGAGTIGGASLYLAFKCYFQPLGDYRTKLMHFGLTRNANHMPLPRG
jgi:hypothetical protein